MSQKLKSTKHKKIVRKIKKQNPKWIKYQKGKKKNPKMKNLKKYKISGKSQKI